MESRLLAEPILAGRKRELKELELGLEAAIMGKGNTIFISGEAGSGKTRLINEFIDEARKKNVTVLAGWCLSNAAVPYLPFIEAFDYFSSNEESDNAAGSQQLGLKSLLMGPNVNVKTETATRELWKEQAFSAVTKELLEMSTKKPVVLVIEDIHWADSASLSLLHYVSRALIYERILVLATFRNEEPAEPEEGNVHSLADTLRLMGREDLFNEIKLANLGEVDVGRIVESMLRGNVHPELTKKLAKESQGNPLFLVESIKFLFEHKRLVRDDGKWQLTIDKVDIPPKVKDIILRRVMALRPEQRRVLEVASVIGDTFDPELLGDVLNQDSLQVLEALNAIYQSNSIVRSEERFFRFDHAKSREIIYEKISPPLRKGYHERIGQVLELKSEQQSSTVSDLAYHYTMSGNAPKSIKYSLAAGKDALVRFSNTEAIKHFTYVLQTLPKTRENTEQRTTALEGLGDAFFASMMFKEAVKSFENLANSDGAHKIKALTKAMEAAFFGNDLSRLIALIAEAEKFNVSDPLENARILMNKGRVQLLQGNAPLAVPYYEQSLRVFEEEYQLWDTAWDLIAYGCNAPTIGELHKGLAALFRSIALFKELGDSRWLVEAYNCTGLICAWAFGFWKESRELFEKALDVHERAKIGDFLRLAQICSQYAWICAAEGNLKGALAKSLEALKYAEKTDSGWATGLAYSNLTRYHSMLGNHVQAREAFGKLMGLPPQVLLNPMIDARLAMAVFYAGNGEFGTAMKTFNAILLDMQRQNAHGFFVGISKSYYAWALGRQGRNEEAAKQLREVEECYANIAGMVKHVNVQVSLMAPVRAIVDQVFEIRLDIVNVSRARGSLVAIKDFFPEGLRVCSISAGFNLKNRSVESKEKTLEPFSVASVVLALQAAEAKRFNLTPKVDYIDDFGNNKTAKPQTIQINVSPKPMRTELEDSALSTRQENIEFGSQAAEKAFDYLLRSFAEDYVRRKMPKEKAGWRTLMDIVRQGKITRHSVYGSSRGRRQTLAELEQSHLIETRMFSGERGRGGVVRKVRVCYEKENIKRLVDRDSTV